MAALNLPRGAPGAAFVAGLLTLALVITYRDGLRAPFLNDDYVFLDKVARTPFMAWWGFDALPFHWWRPWSREFHYGWLARVFGTEPLPFHLANVMLVWAIFASYIALVARVAGRRVAWVSAAGAAAMSGWSLPLLWVAGVQDLWMMLMALLALHAWARERRALAFASYALALASKETAAPLPLLFVAWDLCVSRRAWQDALRRVAPGVALALVWAFAHPHLGGRWLRGQALELAPAAAASRRWHSPFALLATVWNPSYLSAPERGWLAALVSALPLIVATLIVLALAARHGDHAKPNASPRATAAYWLCWAVAGALPLLLPSLGWHAYYGLFAGLGLWPVIGSAFQRHPRWAAVFLAANVVWGAGRADTPSGDWGEASYTRRAAALHARMRDGLRARVPTPAPHTRFYFVGLPNDTGFQTGDGPAVRVWYADSTLRSHFLSAWTPPDTARGESDLFLRFDPEQAWVPLALEPADAAAARAANPHWADDLASVAATFLSAGDARRAVAWYERVARAEPRDAESAYNAGVARLAAADTAGAADWLAEAARRPDVSARVRAAARAAGLELWP